MNTSYTDTDVRLSNVIFKKSGDKITSKMQRNVLLDSIADLLDSDKCNNIGKLNVPTRKEDI